MLDSSITSIDEQHERQLDEAPEPQAKTLDIYSK